MTDKHVRRQARDEMRRIREFVLEDDPWGLQRKNDKSDDVFEIPEDEYDWFVCRVYAILQTECASEPDLIKYVSEDSAKKILDWWNAGRQT